MTTDRKILVFLAFVPLASGIVEAFLPGPRQFMGPETFVAALVFAVGLFTWCKQHARQNGIQPPAGAPLLMGLFSPAGLLYYAFKSYGFRKGGKIVLLGIGYYIAISMIGEAAYQLIIRTRT